ncbi:hypothetical protein AK812_SmicGene40966 [Symbiodinium microadriaticum]|uniref:Uncharacterized protein n=1 Tax=Symbiodinium microadriaticum TaxID=2951 RepID=A0A1Q9C7B8_SYMMI|nr:hypothetical protein AK812_SmicGene40966 [Symbiodinium microadriaticum]
MRMLRARSPHLPGGAARRPWREGAALLAPLLGSPEHSSCALLSPSQERQRTVICLSATFFRLVGTLLERKVQDSVRSGWTVARYEDAHKGAKNPSSLDTPLTAARARDVRADDRRDSTALSQEGACRADIDVFHSLFPLNYPLTAPFAIHPRSYTAQAERTLTLIAL